MSLRRRLFLLLGGLICLLLVGQWLLFRALTRAVAEDVRTVAFRVGEQILSGFSYRTESRGGEGASATATAHGEGEGDNHVVIVTTGSAAEGSELKEAEEPLPPAKEGEPPRFVLRRELHWKSSGDLPEAVSEAAGKSTPESGPESELPRLRKMVLETDETRDVLVVRGPAMKRRIPIPDAQIASTLDRFGSQLLFGNLALLAAGLLAAAVVAHRLTRPLASLTAAAERVGAGELGVAVDLHRAERGPPSPPSDEVGRAIAAFNQMSQRLAELDRENRRLASAEQLSELGEVARGLAHSLRNPLNALGLAIEQGGAPAEIVEGSRRQIRRMDGALRSFLALASAGSAQAETVDLVRLAREVALEALQDGVGRVRIEVEAGDGGDGGNGGQPLVVSGVPAELKAVLQALVVNAVEASPEAGSVQIRLEPGAPGSLSGSVRIRIDDEGEGLPEAVRSRLFEPHVTTKPHGSGMGLFLAQRLVSGRYAGELRLAPREAGGTSAILDLGDRTP